eukprot:TRINITY_DN7547_c0_g1_i7.p1 TRINITY_DN7547_c0_g1~~TRINITY_DN7547_c0_g1_i7.p1  ORF type:complete len:356 (-),score=37.89 TRINITY_DN7547_c0_g1_i7:180-1247(-)
MGIASSSHSTSVLSSSSSSSASSHFDDSTTSHPLAEGSHHMHVFHILLSDYIPQGGDWLSLSLVCKYISSSIMNSLISEHMTFKVRDCRFTWYKPTKIRVKRSRLSSLSSWSSSLSTPIPCHVTSLILDGSGFKSPIPGLPPSLLSLELMHKYNHPLPELPASLERLFLEGYNHPIILPLESRLSFLFCGWKYNQPLPLLPSSLIDLNLGFAYNHPLPSSLPPSLTFLSLSIKYNHPLPALPGHKYNRPLPMLPTSLERLKMESYNHPLILPMKSRLKYLFCGSKYNHPLPLLPHSLCVLHLGKYSHPLLPSHLPPNLKKLHLGLKYNHPLPPVLPSSLIYLHLGFHTHSFRCWI